MQGNWTQDGGIRGAERLPVHCQGIVRMIVDCLKHWNSFAASTVKKWFHLNKRQACVIVATVVVLIAAIVFPPFNVAPSGFFDITRYSLITHLPVAYGETASIDEGILEFEALLIFQIAFIALVAVRTGAPRYQKIISSFGLAALVIEQCVIPFDLNHAGEPVISLTFLTTICFVVLTILLFAYIMARCTAKQGFDD